MFSNSMLILDLRSVEDFGNVHLPNAISIPSVTFKDAENKLDVIQSRLQPRQWRGRKRNFIIIFSEDIVLTQNLEANLRFDGCKEVHVIENPGIFFKNYGA